MSTLTLLAAPLLEEELLLPELPEEEPPAPELELELPELEEELVELPPEEELDELLPPPPPQPASTSAAVNQIATQTSGHERLCIGMALSSLRIGPRLLLHADSQSWLATL